MYTRIKVGSPFEGERRGGRRKGRKYYYYYYYYILYLFLDDVVLGPVHSQTNIEMFKKTVKRIIEQVR